MTSRAKYNVTPAQIWSTSQSLTLTSWSVEEAGRGTDTCLLVLAGHREHHHKALQPQVLQHRPPRSHDADPGLHHRRLQSHCLLLAQRKSNRICAAAYIEVMVMP